MARTVCIVGMGPGNPNLLTEAGRKAILEADLLIGAKRLFEDLPKGACKDCLEATRTNAIVDHLVKNPSWEHAAVLMSGDVGMFSGATALRGALEAIPECKVRSIPGISSSVYFASAFGRPWQDWKTVSAHGVSCNIAQEAKTTSELFLVTGGANTVDVLCQNLADAGLGNYRVSVGERLSYEDERITCGTAEELADKQFDTLAVMLVEAPEDGASDSEAAECAWPWNTHGLPDSAFTRGKVPMTKQDIRAVALSRLKVAASDIVYDIGAGTGSVSIELAMLCPDGHVYAIERNPEGVSLIQQNACTFGLDNINVIEGFAPDALESLPTPDAAFIGGSGSELENIIAKLLQKNPNVRICVTCVTLETLVEATKLLQGEGFSNFEATCINTASARVLGSYHLMAAENPVYILTAEGQGA